jgi:hypothetical protein
MSVFVDEKYRFLLYSSPHVVRRSQELSFQFYFTYPLLFLFHVLSLYFRNFRFVLFFFFLHFLYESIFNLILELVLQPLFILLFKLLYPLFSHPDLLLLGVGNDFNFTIRELYIWVLSSISYLIVTYDLSLFLPIYSEYNLPFHSIKSNSNYVSFDKRICKVLPPIIKV